MFCCSTLASDGQEGRHTLGWALLRLKRGVGPESGNEQAWRWVVGRGWTTLVKRSIWVYLSEHVLHYTDYTDYTSHISVSERILICDWPNYNRNRKDLSVWTSASLNFDFDVSVSVLSVTVEACAFWNSRLLCLIQYVVWIYLVFLVRFCRQCLAQTSLSSSLSSFCARFLWRNARHTRKPCSHCVFLAWVAGLLATTRVNMCQLYL